MEYFEKNNLRVKPNINKPNEVVIEIENYDLDSTSMEINTDLIELRDHLNTLINKHNNYGVTFKSFNIDESGKLKEVSNKDLGYEIGSKLKSFFSKEVFEETNENRNKLEFNKKNIMELVDNYKIGIKPNLLGHKLSLPNEDDKNNFISVKTLEVILNELS